MRRGLSSHHDVTAAVQGQVVGAGEGAVALGAAERLDPRVLAEVSGQLIGAGEAPGAALPGTVVRLLTWRGRDTTRQQSQTQTHTDVWVLAAVVSGSGGPYRLEPHLQMPSSPAGASTSTGQKREHYR